MAESLENFALSKGQESDLDELYQILVKEYHPYDIEATAVNPCDLYKKIQPLLPTIIAVLKGASKIPIVPSKIKEVIVTAASALEVLLQMGDSFCPTAS